MWRLSIGCAISSLDARARVASAIEREGAQPLTVSVSLLSEPATFGCDALVYDLAPWDAGVAALVRRFRDALPACPIFLYYPPGHIAATVYAAVGRLPDVWGKAQLSAPDESRLVAAHIRALLEAAPAARLRTALTLALRHPPSDVEKFVDAAVMHVREESGRRPRVEVLAQRTRVDLRNLERHLQKSGLPRPKRLLDWITLLYVLLAAHSSGASTAAAARRVGLLDGDVFRLSTRLIPDLAPLGHAKPLTLLDWAVARFTVECRLRAGRNGKAAERYGA